LGRAIDWCGRAGISRSAGRAGSRAGSRAGRADIGIVADAELGSVLVLAVGINNDFNTVVGHIGLESRAGCPGVLSAIGDFLNDWVENLDVCRWPVEEEESHGSGGRGVPGNVIGFADGDNLPNCWVDCGVSNGGRAHGLGIGRGQASEGRGDKGSDLELHCRILF